MPDVTYDEPVASRYDDDEAAACDPAVLGPAVDRLAELADGGPALEFAVGTGRVAVPLARRGVPVSGIDASEPMLDRLRAKRSTVAAAVGDMTSTRVEGSFGLVYLVFNTVMNVTSQAGQVATFRNAAAHLRPGGRFVVEVMVPALRKLPPGERLVAFAASGTHLGVDEYDVATQRLWSHSSRLDGDRARTGSSAFRYVWPAELDLMAQLAGMALEHRWADWQGSPFTGESTSHVSVYRTPEG